MKKEAIKSIPKSKDNKMKTYTAYELKAILELHKIGGEKANLSDADLWGFDLSDAGLSDANLKNANLWSADLSNANLSGTNLINANLSNANLRGVNLRDADLSGVNLSDADLRGATLRGATLRGANLINTNLSDADLKGANLSVANLSDANLRGADLWGVFGNMRHIKSLQTEKYTVTYTATSLQIGCKQYSIEEWKKFDDKTISQMDSGALEWWTNWKPIIMEIIEMSPCEPTK